MTMRIKTFAFLTLVLATVFASTAICQDDAAKNKVVQEIALCSPGDWAFESRKPIMDIPPDGVFTVSHLVHFFSTHTFKIQPGRKYFFYAEVRSDYNIRSYVRAAVVYCSKLREMIPVMCYVTAPGDTMTQLVQPTVERQNYIIIKNNPKWPELYKKRYGVVAFNAKQDKSDLPNKKYSTKITSIEPEGENLKVTFEKDLYEEFPAGTNVRLHSTSGFYQTVEEVFPQKEWRQIGGTIEVPANAEYFFPCIIYYGPKEQTVQIRNLRLVIE